MDMFYELNEKALNGGLAARQKLFQDAKNRQFLLSSWLHSADISNPCKNFSICQKWADVVMVEFFRQGDKEREKSMPVSPGFDRDTTSMPTMQVNFIDFVVGPLYQKMIRVFPGMMNLGIQLVFNRDKWGQKIADELHVEKKKARVNQDTEKEKELDAKAQDHKARAVRFRGNFKAVFDMQEQLREEEKELLAMGEAVERKPLSRPLDFFGTEYAL